MDKNIGEYCMELEQRPFAQTGKTVSVFGLGTVKFGRNQKVKYPGSEGFPLPSDGDIEALLDLCLENGVTLLDTAPAYGSSEERLGKLLGARREKFFLVSKTGEEFMSGESNYIFTIEHTRNSVERSLKRLNTDHLDCVIVHSNRDDVKVISETPVLETLSRMKEEGKILSFGVSTYTVEGGKRAVDIADCVMVAYNKAYINEKPVIDYAHEKGKAVLIKKALASGHIETLGCLEDNLRFIARTPGVTCIVVGSNTKKNILSNIRVLENGQ